MIRSGIGGELRSEFGVFAQSYSRGVLGKLSALRTCGGCVVACLRGVMSRKRPGGALHMPGISEMQAAHAGRWPGHLSFSLMQHGGEELRRHLHIAEARKLFCASSRACSTGEGPAATASLADEGIRSGSRGTAH